MILIEVDLRKWYERFCRIWKIVVLML